MKEAAINLSYKAYPRADARRYLTTLLAVDHLKEKATIHYIGLLIGCTRAEAQRGLDAAELQLGVQFERDGSRYKIVSWGVLKKAEVATLIQSGE